MKRVVLAIAATLVLIALPAVAQYTDSSATTQPTTTETTTTTTETTATMPSDNLDTSATTAEETTTSTVPVQEERTNPAVPTHGPGAGLTASGSVISSNDSEIVLRTATGMTHFKLVPETTGVATFAEGQQLTIDFTRNEQGVLIAQQIRTEGTASTMPSGITTPGAAAAGAAVADAASDVAETVDEAVDTTTTAATTTTTDTTASLPATGSKAPLLGLLGLMALGGAAALRRL
jgi:LPXTG-motif cell wall-anchored protein